MDEGQNKKVQELIDGLGAIAEVMKVFSSALRESGFTEFEIMEYMKEYLRCTLVKDYGKWM